MDKVISVISTWFYQAYLIPGSCACDLHLWRNYILPCLLRTSCCEVIFSHSQNKTQCFQVGGAFVGYQEIIEVCLYLFIRVTCASHDFKVKVNH